MDKTIRQQAVHLFSSHPRDWKNNLYVYPVISRRCKGLSIGINLNPDKACNFDCIYCQVDRTVPPATCQVDLAILEVELVNMLEAATDGSIYNDAQFGAVPTELRRINDIAFSGDGEPTTCPEFESAAYLVTQLKNKFQLPDVKIIVITDACYLTRPLVSKALAHLDQHQGEIWAKLDAGTEEYYQQINRPNYPLTHVLKNITAAAQIRPVVIQSLFMRINNEGPGETETNAYIQRLQEIKNKGGLIRLIQIYTVARKPLESYVSPLSNAQVDTITERVRLTTGLPVESFYSSYK